MWKKKHNIWWVSIRHYLRVRLPRPAVISGQQCGPPGPAEAGSQATAAPPSAAVSRPPTARKNWGKPGHVTTVSWIKYYFDEVEDSVIQSHFNSDLVQMECENVDGSVVENGGKMKPMRKIKPNEVMKEGVRVFIPVSVSESRISKRNDTIPSGTLNPNADEIEYLQRLDSALLLLNKPPKFPVKGNLPVHSSMDALAAAALSYGCNEGPKLVHRLDRESSGLLLMGRTKESVSLLNWLFSDLNRGKSSYKHSGFEASQEAATEYRVLGPMINGCSWIELHTHTMRKHQLRVHCAEALGTPIVGDYKYVGLCIRDGSKCRVLTLSLRLGHHTNCEGQKKSEDLPPAISTKPDLIRFSTVAARYGGEKGIRDSGRRWVAMVFNGGGGG
ncbi:hypothetical protein Q3G72_028025 [Acer saccharum]|nr:hypothetical protein Q3G72_028025 [Acer saccharum]